jgi:hypothetical protein
MTAQLHVGEGARLLFVKIMEEEKNWNGIVAGYFIDKAEQRFICYAFPEMDFPSDGDIQLHVWHCRREKEARKWCRDAMKMWVEHCKEMAY